MRLGRLTLDRSALGFQLVDHDSGLGIEISREDARFLFCWLMHRLNVKDATLTDGRKVEGFYHFEEIKKAIELMNSSKEVHDAPKPGKKPKDPTPKS